MPTIEHRRLDSLKKDPRNPRVHSDSQIDQIAASLREFGWTNPILIDAAGTIIAGHGRYEAAVRIARTGGSIPRWPDAGTVPVIVLPHLTEAQRRALVIADNKLALNARWDEHLLAEALADLRAEEFDVQLLGFSDEDLARLSDDLAAAALTAMTGLEPAEEPAPPPRPTSAAVPASVAATHEPEGDADEDDDAERTDDGEEAASAAPAVSESAGGGESRQEVYVPFSVNVTPSDQAVLYDAVRAAKSRFGVTHSGEALAAICRQFLQG